MSRTSLLVPLLLAAGLALAEDAPEGEPAPLTVEKQAQDDKPREEQKKDEQPQEIHGPTEEGPKRISGMSILGNQEAPKSLVIVPWKSSELGDSLGISTMLDDSRQPVDKEVFMRALSYYEIRSE